MKETESNAWARYQAACHAMQSGVEFEHNAGSADGSPKHLRVGINSAMVNDAALVKLLIEKKIITMREYAIAVADEMELEVKRYESRANQGNDGPIRFK